MRILYVFPHPDDESFGPAAAMHSQLKKGHEVFLLTLTKGEATKQRFRLGVDKKEMGIIRYREMLAVEKVLNLSGMEVLDFPDSGLKELDPRILEKAVQKHVEKIKPEIIVSYPVHGISGFHDHLVMHAVIKRVFLDMKDMGATYLKRLAFFTLPDEKDMPSLIDGMFRLKKSEDELIDCIIQLTPEDQNAMVRALDCYLTYQETIKATGVVEKIGDKVYFEIFNESYHPPLSDLTDKIISI